MNRLKFLVLSSILLCVFSGLVFAQKMKAEDVIAKHLESIGTAETRDSIKSHIFVGETTVKYITQKNQTTVGRIVLASSGEKNFWGMTLNSTDYPSEKFSFDGIKAKVGIVRVGNRSILGNFVASNNFLLEESLLGGALSTSWALRNLANRKVSLSYDGTKKIGGKEVYAIGYSVKGSGDLIVTLYFDKTNFRHVRTEYKRTSSAGIGLNPNQSSGFSETRLKVVEEFSDFKVFDGLTLPHSYVLFYSISGQNGTTEIEWKSLISESAFNQPIADSTFNLDAAEQ